MSHHRPGYGMMDRAGYYALMGGASGDKGSLGRVWTVKSAESLEHERGHRSLSVDEFDIDPEEEEEEEGEGPGKVIGRGVGGGRSCRKRRGGGQKGEGVRRRERGVITSGRGGRSGHIRKGRDEGWGQDREG